MLYSTGWLIIGLVSLMCLLYTMLSIPSYWESNKNSIVVGMFLFGVISIYGYNGFGADPKPV